MKDESESMKISGSSFILHPFRSGNLPQADPTTIAAGQSSALYRPASPQLAGKSPL